MSSRKPSPNGRMTWEGRMWDREGKEYEFDQELTSREAKRWLHRDNVQMVIYEFTGPLQWIEHSERLTVWRGRVVPRLHDNAEWRAPRDAPGTRPYVPELWREVGGSARVVVINDRD